MTCIDGPPAGSLTVVGTGIELGVQVTPQARDALKRADEVLYLAAEPLTERWIERLNPNARSLVGFYEPGKNRTETYAEMVEEILSSVRTGRRVAVAFYGHPGVFVEPGHEAVRRARADGYEARMLPAVSAEDCLFADLGLDPGEAGCQSYEATAFLVNRYRIDPAALLILWQVGFLGERTAPTSDERPSLEFLVERLAEDYPLDHETIAYEASPYPVCGPLIRRQPLRELAETEVSGMATLVVPPAATPPPDLTMLDRLGLPHP